MTESCTSWDEVKKIISADPEAVLISGSDQIWNAELEDSTPVYFFPGFRHKISYGSSLGFQISSKTIENVKKYISEYSYIAARETEAAIKLSDITGRDIPTVLDPTLLLKKNEYLPLILDETKILSAGKYILFYSVICDSSVLRKAKLLSKKFKMPIIAVYNGGIFRRALKEAATGFKMDYVTDPGKFIQYIMSAELVLTDSFHGTAMSILFHKDFLRIQEVHDKRIKKDNRIDTLLNSLNLQNRSVSILSDYFPKSSVDWEEIDTMLENRRKESIEWLKNAVYSTAGEK